MSLQAHADQLEILADDSVTVTSVNGNIEIKAQRKIALQSGQSSITLEGSNITFACPGKISVKGGVHGFEGAMRGELGLEGLPSGSVMSVALDAAVASATSTGMATAPTTTAVAPYSGRFQLIDPETQKPTADKAYRIMRNGTVVVEGNTDSEGYTAVATASRREDLTLEFIERV